MIRRSTALAAAVLCLIMATSCSLSEQLPWAEPRYLTDGSDGRAPVGSEGVPVEVGKPMSYSLTSIKATTPGVNPRITDVTIDADDGITLVGVSVLDSKASVGGVVLEDFPPESYFREFPQDRDNYHPGLPTRPVPGGGRAWSLVGGLTTDRLGPTLIRSVTVTYELDGHSHKQTFDVLANLCGYKGDPKTVRCEAPAVE